MRLKSYLLGTLILLVSSNLLGDESQSILLKDDFSDKEKSKLIWEVSPSGVNFDSSRIIFENNIMEVNGFDTSVNFSAGNQDWTDYIYEAKIKILQRGETDNHCGFYLRSYEKEKVQFIMRTNILTYAHSPLLTESDIPEAKDKKVFAKGIVLNQWYVFRFICKGDKIQIIVNGEHVGTIENVPLKGGIGFYAYNCKAQFGNMLVISLGE